ncbi:uncharacterized protein LOC120276048 [Dioscorea cayenensis subsp. rotundata]|uniref:Uncharacterized protein LOC120276048 n=1 Tax=Dioscorea cayennensis subsp. rotundata TaxID=55577 RepID=A0AB40CFW7_DIOCR|nr:uncharacterized protein LOC120276048 [Dioscorea cayenensis subsp. rotundata]
MTGRNCLPSGRWSGVPTSQSRPVAASVSSFSSAVQSDAAPTATPDPISIPSTIASTTVSVPPTSTTPAPVAVTTVGPRLSISSSTEGGDAYASHRVRIYVQSGRWHKYYEETSKKPVWVEDEVWNKWLAYWNKDEFKHKSRQASNNRRSETGGEGNGMSRHIGGSKSFVEHAIDLSKSLQKPPTAFDIFCKTHISKEGKGVDSRAQDAMQKMVETVSQPLSDGSQPSPPNMDAICLEASGGEKKRRVYGLGSQPSSLYPNSFCSGATSAPHHLQWLLFPQRSFLRWMT